MRQRSIELLENQSGEKTTQSHCAPQTTELRLLRHCGSRSDGGSHWRCTLQAHPPACHQIVARPQELHRLLFSQRAQRRRAHLLLALQES